MILIEIGDL